MAQQMHNGDFDRPLPIDRERGRKRKAEAEAPEANGGFFYVGLTPELQASLVEMTRLEAVEARKAGREALVAQEAEQVSRREERVITLLNKAHHIYTIPSHIPPPQPIPANPRGDSPPSP